jgi:uncharacterized protein involved in response to NO
MSDAGRTAAGRRFESRIPLLRLGFRPFFLAAGMGAIAAMAAWVATLTGAGFLPSAFEPIAWHIHEMIFGYAMAAVAGFLLTAIPNWTGRLPVAGPPLAVLVALWLAGRIACAVSAVIGAAPAALIDLAFPAALLFVVVRELVAGANRRNLPMALAVLLMFAGNALMHLEAMGTVSWPGIGWRLGLSVLLMLIVLVGGRIVPSFTRNWLVKRGGDDLPATFGWFDRVVMAGTGAALVFWISGLAPVWAGVFLAVAGIVNLARLGRWQGRRTGEEPLVWVLHLGYGWLGAGLIVLGLALSAEGFSPGSAVHALTIGAVGTMTLGVMTRASRGHSGRSLTADIPTTLCYVLVGLAALVRVLAEAVGWEGAPPLLAAAGLWMAAFALFVAAYLPMWTSSRPAA